MSERRGRERGRQRGAGQPDFDACSVAELAAGRSASPSQVLAGNEQQRLLLAGLRRIPLRAQLVLELFYWEELGTREIAEILELPHGTVRSRVRAARHALEAELGALAREGALLKSTVDNLERWLSSMHAQLDERGGAS